MFYHQLTIASMFHSEYQIHCHLHHLPNIVCGFGHLVHKHILLRHDYWVQYVVRYLWVFGLEYRFLHPNTMTIPHDLYHINCVHQPKQIVPSHFHCNLDQYHHAPTLYQPVKWIMMHHRSPPYTPKSHLRPYLYKQQFDRPNHYNPHHNLWHHLRLHQEDSDSHLDHHNLHHKKKHHLHLHQNHSKLHCYHHNRFQTYRYC